MSAHGTIPKRRIKPPVRPLVDGERMEAIEFHRRYAKAPINVWAELVDGVVHLTSRVPPSQAEAHFRICAILGFYVAHTSGIVGHNRPSFRLDRFNEYQPELLLTRGDDSDDGPGIVTGSSELAVEICRTSRTIDFTKKFRVYREHKVAEYMIWDVKQATLHWWRLIDGKYEPLVPDAKGIIRSVGLPGLWLDTVALKNRDRQAALHTLQLGVASPEHVAFGERLKTEAPSP